jgi:hypothetical protein
VNSTPNEKSEVSKQHDRHFTLYGPVEVKQRLQVRHAEPMGQLQTSGSAPGRRGAHPPAGAQPAGEHQLRVPGVQVVVHEPTKEEHERRKKYLEEKEMLRQKRLASEHARKWVPGSSRQRRGSARNPMSRLRLDPAVGPAAPQCCNCVCGGV